MEEIGGRAVVAAFKHRAQAQRAVDALLDAGFAATAIEIEDRGSESIDEGSAPPQRTGEAAPGTSRDTAAASRGRWSDSTSAPGGWTTATSWTRIASPEATETSALDRWRSTIASAVPSAWPIAGGAMIGAAAGVAGGWLVRGRTRNWLGLRPRWQRWAPMPTLAGLAAGTAAGVALVMFWREAEVDRGPMAEPYHVAEPGETLDSYVDSVGSYRDAGDSYDETAVSRHDAVRSDLDTADGATTPGWPVAYDEGSLDRGHAIVRVFGGERIAEAETLLRAFGGRGVHLAPSEAGTSTPSSTSERDATTRMDVLSS